MSTRLDTELNTLRKHGLIKIDLPDYITDNLNKKLELRPYQKEAISSFIYYFDELGRQKPTQNLFHMATGSGKTLVMAAEILFLYERGYRNFIFFVNSTNIIEKTKDNFLNPFSSKYLFAKKISFKDRIIQIKKVDNFETTNKEDIHILFTTIQGLHTSLNFPKENSVNFEDFADKKIVLLSDEAHHINTMTMSKLSREKQLEKNSWELTVNKIFKSNLENILLEFTATTDFEHAAVSEKYKSKIVYDYSLKQYRQDGYSKEVKVLESDAIRIERAIQALLISQHRRKVAEKNKLHVKPVILMKSKTIEESEKFENEFHNKIKQLKEEDLRSIFKKSKNPTLKRATEFFNINNISISNLIIELKEDFNEDKCVSVNSKNDSEEKQILVNTLEDKDNAIRVVFAVDKLNEGWDVLNLFDIVRLYDTRDSKGKPGKTTVAEAQLIGRGARYYPFQMDDSNNKFERKFDSDIENELRVLEELYYHSSYNPKYIQELHQALRETGIIPETKKEIQVRIKDSFKKSKFWKTGHLFINKKIPNDRSNIKDFSDIQIPTQFKFSFHTGYTKDTAIFESGYTANIETKTKTFKLSDFGRTVVQKAAHKFDFYKFSNLKTYFPKLTSMKQFVTSDKYLGNIEVEVTGLEDQLSQLTLKDKLDVSIFVIEKLISELQKEKTEYVGTQQFVPIPIRHCAKNKTLNVSIETGRKEIGTAMSATTDTDLRLVLPEKEWYVYDENYGTSEEKYLVKFLHNAVDKLKTQFEDVYLLRNEKLFQLYRFSDGKALEPDFALFLKNKTDSIMYQLFIEPKGEHLLDTDRWKEEFLESIESKYKITAIFENKNFKIVGMSFYNEKITKSSFTDKFENILQIPMRA